jgi:DNA-binding NarL/FixJ family response regulator
VFGVVVAAFMIEMTVPEPAIIVAQPTRDIMIIGVPTIGYITLAIILFTIERSAFFPRRDASMASDKSSLPDLEVTSQKLAESYSLTVREKEILNLLLQGRSGPYIAEDLYLSKSTIKTHIKHIYGKTGVSNRQQLIDLTKAVR